MYGVLHSALLAGIRVFAFWTPSLKAFYQTMILLNFYNFGIILLLLVRASLDAICPSLFPYVIIFLVGLFVYEAAAFRMAHNMLYNDDKKDSKNA
jgi:hypothetical protein